MSSAPQPAPGPMTVSDPSRWVELLRSCADTALSDDTPGAVFRRNLTRGPWWLETPVMLHTLSLERREDQADAALDVLRREMFDAVRRKWRPDLSDDVIFWWQLAGQNPEEHRGVFDLKLDRCVRRSGPILAQDAAQGIEVWTESELAALHACTHIRHPALDARISQAVDWHITNTQPDNATHHPWAIQAFITHGTPESLHFAQTLLSNCLVTGGGHPDLFSAWILRNAVLSLQRGLSVPGGDALH